MLKGMSRVNTSGHATDGDVHCSASGQISVTTGVKINKVARKSLQHFLAHLS